MSFSKIITLCQRHGFLKHLGHNGKINSDVIKIGPTGALLQENLKHEWFQNIVMNKEISVFYSHGDFKETYDYVKGFCMNCVPFGIAEVVPINKKTELLPVIENSTAINFNDFFSDDLLLKCTIFLSPSNSTQMFHQWQRQRRTWWRIFSASPGRYILTDIRDNSSALEVKIQSKYLWGMQLLEDIRLHSEGSPPSLTKSDLEIKEKRKTVHAHFMTSEIRLSTMLLNSLCDAYDEPMFQGQPRPLLRFHRKLAPYKVSFTINSTKAEFTDELKDLGLYLCKQLRTNHISCLYLPTSSKLTLDTQWKQYDQLGIPYNVLLNEGTLKNGTAHLRSRDTTLKEQVHVTKLASYMEELFKNY